MFFNCPIYIACSLNQIFRILWWGGQHLCFGFSMPPLEGGGQERDLDIGKGWIDCGK